MITSIHIVACDLCGREVELPPVLFLSLGSGRTTPGGWINISAHEHRKDWFKKDPTRLSIHLEICPECYKTRAAEFYSALQATRVTIEPTAALDDILSDQKEGGAN